MPKALRDHLGWCIQIIGLQSNGQEAVVAHDVHPAGTSYADRVKQRPCGPTVGHSETEDGNAVILTAQLNTLNYSNAYAEVIIDSTPGTPGGILVDQRIH